MKNSRKLSDLFYNNRFLLIFSVVAAVIIWVVVAVEFSPETTITVRNVPIRISSTGLIDSKKLEAFGAENLTVDVTVVGKRYIVEDDSIINDLDAVANTASVTKSGTHTKEGRISATQMMERFLFSSDLQFSTIGRLSGGERRRLYLLGILMSAPNILLLDEPTNDLDVETLTILEDYLTEFPGAVVAVSHDRYFLDKIATSILEVRGDGEVRRTMGGYSDWLLLREMDEKPPVPKENRDTREKRTDRPQKLKFSFKEQREYETIDQDIASLEARIADCDTEIGLNASNYVRLQEIMEEKSALEAQLEEKTERWVYLYDLAERIAVQDANK